MLGNGQYCIEFLFVQSSTVTKYFYEDFDEISNATATGAFTSIRPMISEKYEPPPTPLRRLCFPRMTRENLRYNGKKEYIYRSPCTNNRCLHRFQDTPRRNVKRLCVNLLTTVTPQLKITPILPCIKRHINAIDKRPLFTSN